jgi:hypothetical protein
LPEESVVEVASSDPVDENNRINAFATGVDEDAMVAVPIKEPRHDESDGAVTGIVVDAEEKTSAGPLEG